MVKRILFILSLISMFWVCNVFATTSDYWAEGMTLPTGVYYYGFSSATSYTELPTTFHKSGDILSDSGIIGEGWNAYSNSNRVANDTNGLGIVSYAGTLKSGYLYSFTYYLCGTTNVRPNGTSAFVGNSVANTLNGSLTSYTNVSYTPISTLYASRNAPLDPVHGDFTLNWCTANTGLVVPSVDSYWVALKVRNTTTTTQGYISILGYELKELGIFTDTIASTIDGIVANSGLATAQSVTEVQNEVKEVQKQVEETNNAIKDNNVDDPNFNEFEDYLADNGVITQLITLPVQLYTKILNGINGTCNTFNLGNLWGSDLTLPCIQPQEYLGSTLWNTIDVLFSGFFIFVISKKMISVFEQFTNLKEGDILD